MTEEVQFSIKSADGVYSFEVTEEITLGRDSSCAAFVPDKSLSRQHARLYLDNKNLYVEDLNSTNGTFVNGNKVGQESVLLRYNDTVRFDQMDFTVFVELVSQQKSLSESPVLVTEEVSSQPSVPSVSIPVSIPASKSAATPAVTSGEQVVEASTGGSIKAPRSWAVQEEIGHGTVVMDPRDGDIAPEDNVTVKVSVQQALAQKVGQTSLIGLEGVDAGKTITLVPKNSGMTVWNMGRAADMNICINDPGVSEHQSQIIYEQNTWKLVDVISTNATYVNQEKILIHYLSNGDVLAPGPAKYMFRLAGKEARGTRAANIESVSATSREENRELNGRTSTPSSSGYLKMWATGAAILLIGLIVISMLVPNPG